MSLQEHRRSRSHPSHLPPRPAATLTPFQQSFLAPQPSQSSVLVDSQAAEVLRMDEGSTSDLESGYDPHLTGHTPRARSEPYSYFSHPFAASRPPAPASAPAEDYRRGAGGSSSDFFPPPIVSLPEIPPIASGVGGAVGEGRMNDEQKWERSAPRDDGAGPSQAQEEVFPRSPSTSDDEKEELAGGEEKSPSTAETDLGLGVGRRAGPAHSHELPPHLPKLEEQGNKDPTATENWKVVESMEYAISKVVRKHVLEELMKDRNAFHRFREFIAQQPDRDPRLLDFYNDISVLCSLSTQLRLASESVKSVYLTASSPDRLTLPISIRGPVLESLHRATNVGVGLVEPQKEVLSSLFTGSFESYMTEKLVEHVCEKLKRWDLGGHGARDPGLGDAFVLTNPRLRDNPIVLTSAGFPALTEYDAEEIIGRSCRFLQGPGTAPSSVTVLRESLRREERVTQLLLNYRRDGSPFFNLLCLQPLKDSSGIVRYFLGGQIDVTSSISSLADPFSSRPHSSTQLKLSPAVRKHQEALLAEIRKHKADEVDGGKESSDTLHVMMPRSEDGFERKGKVKGKQSAEESGGPNGTSGNGGAKNWVEKTLKKVASSASGGAKKGDQVGMTDEEHERMEAARQPLMAQIRDFETTYSRVILLRSSTREILFVTPELLTFCNVSTDLANSLSGLDFTRILTSPRDGHEEDSDRGHRIRRNVKSAIKAGHCFSTPCGLKIATSRKLFGIPTSSGSEAPVTRECTLHLTPLSDRDGTVEAFVAVFG